MKGESHKVCSSCGFIGSAAAYLLVFRDVKCPKCKRACMVPLSSSTGRMVLSQRDGQPKTWSDTRNLAGLK